MRKFSNILGFNESIQQKPVTESNLSALGTDGNGKRWEDYDEIECPDGTIINMNKLLDDQARAKAALVHMAPALGGFVGALRFVYTFHIPTQATDGYNILVNPQFTNKLDLTEKCFVMAHEIMHCLLQHMRRGKGHEPMRSNIAADYECNITLSDTSQGGMGLFKIDTMKKIGAYVDEKYATWGYERIYTDKDLDTGQKSGSMGNNSQNQQGSQQQGGSGSQSGNGSGNGQEQPKSPDYIAGWKQAIEDWKKKNLKK